MVDREKITHKQEFRKMRKFISLLISVVTITHFASSQTKSTNSNISSPSYITTLFWRKVVPFLFNKNNFSWRKPIMAQGCFISLQ